MALPEFVPSDAVTVEEPVAAAGTVNAQLLLAGRLPRASAVQVPDVLTEALLYLIVSGLFGVKLLPLSVTMLPTGPEVGFRLRAGLTV